MRELAADAGDHPLFEVGIGLGGAVGLVEQIVHGVGLVVSGLGGGIGAQAGFELGAFLRREIAMQGGGDQVVEGIVRGGGFHRLSSFAFTKKAPSS